MRTILGGMLPAASGLLLLAGCATVPNQWREDGPSVREDWDSPTARDVVANHEPAEPRSRDWDAVVLASDRGEVTHFPSYFEDPFEDKGAGRKGRNKYYVGWEDYVAMLYGYPRFTVNWMFSPVSACVTPPWTLMESDGELSRQALGYDHDATRSDKHASEPPADTN